MEQEYPSLCGHTSDSVKVVRYSSHKSEIIHQLCADCYRKGLFYAPEVPNPPEDILIDGGAAFAEIWL